MFLVAHALANGLTTHVTISEYALQHVADEALAELLTDPDLWLQLQNGTQFPDGGYPLGHAYAETAHWEPFQDRYLAWIAATYGGDYGSAEARQHVAFLMGLGSHGMADQVFDSLYMQRAYVYDADSDWENTSMDTATDVAIAERTGGQQTVDAWADWDTMVTLMAEAGVEVDSDTLQEGQALTQLAITFGRTAGGITAQTELYRAQFPWAYEHILDEAVDGSPPWEARAVAAYWNVRWARLHGEVADNEPVIYTFPQDGGYGHPVDASTVESRLTVVMSRAVVADLVLPDFFTVTDVDGHDYPVDPWVFYGTGSHTVHLVPQADWPKDTDFDVTVHAGIPFIDGSYAAEEVRFGFSTRAPPAEGEPPVYREACACQAAAPPSLTTGLALATLAAARRRRSTSL